MKYFIGREVQDKPYLIFDCIAMSDEELAEYGVIEDILRKNKLILSESEIPENIFGICPYIIKDEKYVKRSEADIQKAKVEYSKDQNSKELQNLDNKVSEKLRYFVFDKTKFSLSVNAQNNWNRIGMLYANNMFSEYLDLSTYDDSIYRLKRDSVKRFIQTFHDHINHVLSSANKEKLKIQNSI